MSHCNTSTEVSRVETSINYSSIATDWLLEAGGRFKEIFITAQHASLNR